MTKLNMDFRLVIVAIGFLVDFECFVAGSNGVGSFGFEKSSQNCRVFCLGR